MGGIKNFESNLTRRNLLGDTADNIRQIKGAVSDMYKEYKLMKSHGYKYLDDYYHCKANYNATKRGTAGEKTAEIAGDIKESFDYYRNIYYRKMNKQDAGIDYINDISINQLGRNKAKYNSQLSAQDACAELRDNNNRSLPKKYW